MNQKVMKVANVIPPNLLGAHRYTIFDGMCALPRVSCREPCPYRTWATGEALLPLRHKIRAYPIENPQRDFYGQGNNVISLRILRVPAGKVVITWQNI